MSSTTTPSQRLKRLLDEGARFMVQLPGQTSIDITPDVMATLDRAGEANGSTGDHDRLTRPPGHNHETDST